MYAEQMKRGISNPRLPVGNSGKYAFDRKTSGIICLYGMVGITQGNKELGVKKSEQV